MKYSVQSDVWAVGITLVELVLAKFPFPPNGQPLSVFEMLDYIVNEPVPTLPSNLYTLEFRDFISERLIIPNSV